MARGPTLTTTGWLATTGKGQSPAHIKPPLITSGGFMLADYSTSGFKKSRYFCLDVAAFLIVSVDQIYRGILGPKSPVHKPLSFWLEDCWWNVFL